MEIRYRLFNVTSDGYTGGDESHPVFDKHHIKKISNAAFSFLFFLGLYFTVTKWVRGTEDIFRWEAGGLSLLLVFRTILIDTVIMPIFSLSIHTISSICLQSKLASGTTVTRGLSRQLSRNYGFNPYEALSLPIWMSWWIRFKKRLPNLSTSKKWIYRLLAYSNPKLGYLTAYTTGSMQEYFKKLERSLETDQYEKFPLSSLSSVLIKGGPPGFWLAISILKYNRRLKELEDEYERYRNEYTETNIENLRKFCMEVKEKKWLYDKQVKTKYADNGFSIIKWILRRNQGTVHLGLLYNRVKRYAGIVLLRERLAFRKVNVKGRTKNLILSLIVVVLGTSLRLLTEASINVGRTAPVRVSENVIRPVPGSGSWDCTRVSKFNMNLSNIDRDTSRCLWGNKEDVTEVNIERKVIKTVISKNHLTSAWTAEPSFLCDAQKTTGSMPISGGFLQVCHDIPNSKILLILENLVDPENTVEVETDAIEYTSQWINLEVKEDIVGKVGVREVGGLELLILNSIRDKGIGFEETNEGSEFSVVTSLITSWRNIYIVAGVLGSTLVLAFSLKFVTRKKSGKINLKSDDHSMLSSLYISLFGLPVSNIVYHALTPEIRVKDTTYGTKNIDIVDQKRYGSNGFKDEKRFFPCSGTRNQLVESKKSDRSKEYKKISWEEIQGSNETREANPCSDLDEEH